MEDPRYPIGDFDPPATYDMPALQRAIDHIAVCPKEFRAAATGLSDSQLDTPYRDGGWTVRQVVHHVPDSHMNAYIRSKLTVAEDHPRITAYNQDHWVRFADVQQASIKASLNLLDSLHERWVLFLRSLPESAFARTLDHPENGTMSLATVTFLYDWHGRHHTAHITSLRRRMGWK
jgi:uncharacterized damage-inducible protein DinB